VRVIHHRVPGGAPGASRPLVALAVVAGLLAGLSGACRTATTTTTTTTEEPAGPSYVPPPPYVFQGLHQLGPAVFADVTWGRDGIEELVQGLELERYDTDVARWGPPGDDVPVLEVRSARRLSTTAFLMDPEQGTVRTVLVRDLPQPPPPQSEIQGFMDYLEAFPGKIHVYAYPEEDGGHGKPYRFLFVADLGVKIGLGREGDGLWYLDHVEYFDPAWDAEALSGYKYGGVLVEIDTIGPLERR